MKLLFAHGWGFDRHFWDGLARLLPQWEQVRDDRGYFGDPLPLNVTGPCIAVAHSFGTMRILADPPAGLAGLVAINGFERFTALRGRPGVPFRVVDLMLRQFDRDPRAVAGEFRRRLGCEEPFAEIDPGPLRADLLRLRDARPPLPAVPVLVLHGAADPLLPEAMREACFPGIGARRLQHETAGHLLPLEDPHLCAQVVRGMVELAS
ncbi:MAG TPA: alpha/beta hydrolase [Novosphingobium sp.]|nr:alpha/beta hydrolase [Novosphingobium sp.]